MTKRFTIDRKNLAALGFSQPNIESFSQLFAYVTTQAAVTQAQTDIATAAADIDALEARADALEAEVGGLPILAGPQIPEGQATTDEAGLIELATQAETDAGADAEKAVTPATLAATTALDERMRDVIGTALVAGSNVTITVSDGGDTITIASSGGGGGGDSGALHVQDQKAASSDAGTFTSGAWQTRVLNTTVSNSISGASLSSNQITLPAGTYDIRARAPAFRVTHHQAKLYNVTDAADILLGSVQFSATSTNNGGQDSVVQGRFTLAAQKVVELQHRCLTTLASAGLGSGSGASWGTVVFADVFIRKVS